MKALPTICIVGRTNVGKSSLFNAIAGKKIAIVDDYHGVTRDRNYALVERHSAPFYLIDTGGITDDKNEHFRINILEQVEIAINESDLILAVFDAKAGLNPLDKEVVNTLRKHKKEIIWIANKAEKDVDLLKANELYELGVDELHTISAAHNIGVRELIKNITSRFEKNETKDLKGEDSQIRVAIIGKPNVGKSTFVNKVLGDERLITSNISGTTRDSIHVKITRNNQDFLLIDTAGLRKKSKIQDATIERYSSIRSLKALAQADVVVILLDAGEDGATEQDLKMASLAHERGKSIVFVINKWDTVEKDHKTVKEFKDKLYESFVFAKYAPIIFISALTGRRCPSVLDTAKKVYENAGLRIKTNELNNLLAEIFAKNPPPVYRGNSIKLFFATHVATHPPTFVLFVNYPTKLTNSYRRYIKNSIRKTYKFEGVDIKIIFRKKKSTQNELNS